MKEKNPTVDSLTVRKYITEIAQKANLYPEKGQYSTEPEEADILEEKYDAILEGMNKFLSTI